MSYHRYMTEGVIVGKLPVGESSMLALVFTRELGLVAALAQSARELQSKLRYSLIEFSVLNLELIRGKERWKFLGGETLLSFSAEREKEDLALMASWSKLLRRLLHGEEENRELYAELREGIELLREGLDAGERSALETLVVARMLKRLGYWGENGRELEAPLSREALRSFAPRRAAYVLRINEALKESHL